MKKKVLVTGGLGFIGSHIVRALHDEYEMLVIDWKDTPEARQLVAEFEALGIKTYQSDIADPGLWKSLEACEYVFHAAAQVSASESQLNPARDFQTNAFGTYLVAEFARTSLAGVIYCNSVRVYDPEAVQRAIQDKGVVDETCATINESRNPQPPFSLSKYTAEQCLLHYARTGRLRLISLRMSGIVGPGQVGSKSHGWLSFLVDCAVRNKTYTIFGDGTQTRDILHIADLVDLVGMQLRDFDRFVDEAGSIYNVGGGPANELSINTVIGILQDQFGFQAPHAYHEPRLGEPRRYVTDTTKMSRRSWKARRDKPLAIITELVNWHKGRHAHDTRNT